MKSKSTAGTSELQRLPPELLSQIVGHAIERTDDTLFSCITYIDVEQAMKLSIASEVCAQYVLSDAKRMDAKLEAHHEDHWGDSDDCDCPSLHEPLETHTYKCMLWYLIVILEALAPSELRHEAKILILNAALPYVELKDVEPVGALMSMDLVLENSALSRSGRIISKKEVAEWVDKLHEVCKVSKNRTKRLHALVKLVRS